MATFLLLTILSILIPGIRRKLDQCICSLIQKAVTAFKESPDENETMIQWINFLLSRIRSGSAVEEAVKSSLKELHLSEGQNAIGRQIIEQQETNSLIGKILLMSIKSGGPCIPSLRKLKKSTEIRIYSERKARATTLQYRAQAILMCTLPWLILSLQSILSPEIFLSAIHSWITQILLGTAFLATVIGFKWMNHINRNSLFTSSVPIRNFETGLQNLLQSIQSQLLSGESPGQQIQSLLYLSLKKSLQDSIGIPNQLSSIYFELNQALEASQNLGAPISEQIDDLIQELNDYHELRLIERTQILPIKLLLPISTTILPASILTIAAPIIPLAIQALEF